MRRRFRLTSLTVAVAVLGLCTAGCLPFVPSPYIYQSLSLVQGVKVEEPRDEVHAFRVDVADDLSCIEFARAGSYRLTEIPVWPGGWTAPQAKVAVDGGWIWNCIALIYGQHTAHTLRVRLYRPGYELVELKSWDLADPVEWKTAGNPLAEEQALDDLLGSTGRGFGVHSFKRDGEWSFAHLGSGRLFPWNRQPLEFAAGEYERLAAKSSERERCLEKAKQLRSIAAGPSNESSPATPAPVSAPLTNSAR